MSDIPETPALDTVADWIELPKGSVPESGIVIVSYLNPEGENFYVSRELGHGQKTEIIGTMVAVIHGLLHSIMPQSITEVEP